MVNSDKRRIFFNTLIVTTATIFEKGIFFVLNIIIARYLNVNEFGDYSAALVYATFFSIFCDIGINQTLIRFINLNRDKTQEYFGKAVGLKTVLSIGVYLVMAISLYFANFNPDTIILTLIFGIVRIGNEFHKAFYAYYDAKESFRIPSIANMAFTFSLLAGTVLVVVLKGSYFHLAYVRLAVVVTILILLAVLTLRYADFSEITKDIKYFVMNAVPFGLHSIAGNVIQRINGVILSQMHDTYYTGIFNNANFFFITLFFIPINFNRVLVPYLYKIDFKENKEKFQFAFDIFSKVFGLISFYIAIIFFIFSSTLVTLIFGEKYSDTIPVLTVISIGIPFLFNIGTIIITALDKQKINTKIFGISALFNILANFLLIYLFKAEGAALATVLTFGLIFILSHGYIQQMGYISLKKTIRGYGILITISLLCFLSHKYFFIQFHWIIAAIGVTVLYGLLVLLFMIRADDIRIVKEIFFGAKLK